MNTVQVLDLDLLPCPMLSSWTVPLWQSAQLDLQLSLYFPKSPIPTVKSMRWDILIFPTGAALPWPCQCHSKSLFRPSPGQFPSPALWPPCITEQNACYLLAVPYLPVWALSGTRNPMLSGLKTLIKFQNICTNFSLVTFVVHPSTQGNIGLYVPHTVLLGTEAMCKCYSAG